MHVSIGTSASFLAHCCAVLPRRFEPTQLEGLPTDDPIAYISGRVAVDASGKAFLISKSLEPFRVIAAPASDGNEKPQVEGAADNDRMARLKCGVGRGCTVSESGRLFRFTVPRLATDPGGAEGPESVITEVDWCASPVLHLLVFVSVSLPHCFSRSNAHYCHWLCRVSLQLAAEQKRAK